MDGPSLPGAYRPLVADASFRQLMPVFALSDLAEGMSTVAVAWLAFTIAPESAPGQRRPARLDAALRTGRRGPGTVG